MNLADQVAHDVTAMNDFDIVATYIEDDQENRELQGIFSEFSRDVDEVGRLITVPNPTFVIKDFDFYPKKTGILEIKGQQYRVTSAILDSWTRIITISLQKKE